MLSLKDFLVESKKLLVYHGTGKSFNRFDLKKATQGIIWFTSDKDNILKGEVGAESSGYILTCEVTINNPAGWDEYDKYALDQLSSMGYDGAILTEIDGFDCFVFSAKQVKIIKSEKISNLVKESSEDYMGSHKAPDKMRGTPLHDLTGVYPDDIYSNNAARYYGDEGGDANDVASARLMQAYRNKPNAMVKIYRAVPDTNKEAIAINPGDWVTLNKNYAIHHGKTSLRGKYKILDKSVAVKTLYTDANSIHEFGYDPH